LSEFVAELEREETCNHMGYWDPTKGPLPEPTQMIFLCDCGENAGCPICGYGWGNAPCSCERERRASR
jgi:hypothetical protein